MIVKYFIRFKPGWIILHAAVITFFVWMGHFVHF